MKTIKIGLFILVLMLNAVWYNKAFADMIVSRPMPIYQKELSPEELQAKDLIDACKEGDLTRVRQLIKQGADVNKSNSDNETPLMFASAGGYDKVVRVLLSAGANVNAASNSYRGGPVQYTALYFACENGHLQVVKTLLAHGADVNTLRRSRDSALVAAAGHGYLEIVKKLLSAGAESGEIYAALRTAIYKRDVNIVKVLINAKPSKQRTSKGPYCNLGLAYEVGDMEIIKTLKEAGCAFDKNDTSSLLNASSNGNVEAVKDLLSTGIDINKKAHLQHYIGGCVETPLSHWLQSETALQGATGSGHLELVKILINAGADVNIKNFHGDTALMFASQVGHTEIVKELIAAGADLNIKDSCGYTALILASVNKHKDIVKILLDAGAINESKDLLSACSKNQVEKVKSLISEGADVDGIELYTGTTCLMYSSGKGNLEMIKMLLASKAKIDKKNNWGHTALMYASTGGQVKAIKELIKAGANINATDNPGRMSLAFAVEANKTEAVKALLAAGANVKGVGKNYGGSALEMAKRAGNTEIVEILKKAGAKE